MQTKETIIIFQEPDFYFFPHYKDIIFKPYDISPKSIWYIVYRFLHLCRIPLYTYFWKSWSKYISTAKHIIIFDYGYQRGMENYILKKNPHCKVSLFIWNKVDAYHKNHTIFSKKDAIYSTDPCDCKTYHLKYNHIFYPLEYRIPYCENHQNVLFFLGVDKNRGLLIKQLKHILTQSGLNCDIRIITHSRNTDYLKNIEDVITTTSLSYTQYLEKVKNSGILLDIVQPNQQALTMRVMEALFLTKKLITNNQDIQNYDFYHPNNILILPETWDDTLIPLIRDFMNKPFIPYDNTILEQYDFNHWLSNFDF